MKSYINTKTKYFDKHLTWAQEFIGDFQVRSRGQSKKIKYAGSNYGMRFSDGNLKGAFLCGMVQRDINNYIKEHGTPKKPNVSIYHVTKFNIDLIEESIDLPMKAIDCDYFYFKIARDRGYISEETFQKGISKADYKDGRLAAIGRLQSREFIEDYQNGKLVGDRYLDEETYKKYSPFYWNIIYSAWHIMEDIFAKFPEEVFMWLTDCAFVKVDSEKRITEYLEKIGHKVKKWPITFKNVDYGTNTISWYDYKSERNKSIHFTKYDTQK